VSDDLRGIAGRSRWRDLGNAYGRRPDSFLDRLVGRLRRPVDRALLTRAGRLDDHRNLGRSAAAAEVGESTGERVLVLALRSWVTHAAYEVVLAHALRLRGCEVALVTCGGGQPACEMGFAREGFPRPCDRCAWFTEQVSQAAGLRHYRLADGFDWPDARNAPLEPPTTSIDTDGAAAISIPWFMRTARPASTSGGAEVARDFRVSVAADGNVFEAIVDDFQPDVMVMVSGLFASERAAWDVARRRGIRVVTYEMAPHGPGIVFAQDAAAPEYPSDEFWQAARGRPLTPVQDSEIRSLLDGRTRNLGTHDIEFESGERELRAGLGIPTGAPIAGLFPNVTFDSAALFKDVAFDGLIDWVAEAVRAVADTPTHLVVRVHPAEARWGTNEPVEPLVRQQLGQIPPNVHFIPSASPLNSYALLRECALALVYTSTIGLEASAIGIPVAVAGICHYRDKGFTIDIDTRESLRRVLAEPPQLSDEQRELARRYAYLFFVRMMIPFPVIERDGLRTAAMPDDAAQIAPGADDWVDFACDRILDGGPFIRPA
jgi:hypothetical protein